MLGKRKRLDLAIVVDAVGTRGIAVHRLLTETSYLITWPEFPVSEDPVPLALPSAPNAIRNRVDVAMREAAVSYEISLAARSCECSTHSRSSRSGRPTIAIVRAPCCACLVLPHRAY